MVGGGGIRRMGGGVGGGWCGGVCVCLFIYFHYIHPIRIVIISNVCV